MCTHGIFLHAYILALALVNAKGQKEMVCKSNKFGSFKQRDQWSHGSHWSVDHNWGASHIWKVLYQVFMVCFINHYIKLCLKLFLVHIMWLNSIQNSHCAPIGDLEEKFPGHWGRMSCTPSQGWGRMRCRVYSRITLLPPPSHSKGEMNWWVHRRLVP